MKSKHIKMFVFDKAQYFVGDGNGNNVILQINYHLNTFEVRSKKVIVDQHFTKEVEKIAKELLHRKHGKNFAND